MAITINVEGIAGSSIENVSLEMCVLSNKLDVYVKTNFNGVILLAGPNDDPKGLVEAFHEELLSKHQIKIARAKQ